MSELVHKRLCYRGRVQGVGFRYSVKRLAAGYEVVGWIRNLPDGTVEMEASGETDEMEAFEHAIATSHLADHIRGVERSQIAPPKEARRGFEIRH